MTWRAFRISLGLSLLFMLVYGACNWITAQRTDVPSFYWSWEQHIPFVPVMIVPYMSIDLFFVAAPFLCRGRSEQSVLARQISMAILVAGACFLLMPLRCAFERPQVAGPLGAIFNNFRAIDLPFNQFPSLHIALRTILAVFYVRRTSGVLRWVLRVWFSLIGFSVVLTYQHQVIDVIGGFVLAAACFYVFPARPNTARPTRNPRVGIYYAAAAAMLLAAALFLRPWGYVLLWPALSVGIVSAGYFGMGAAVFRKEGGRLPFSTWVIHWPVLLAHHLSLAYYRRRGDAWNVLTERVWIGRKLNQRQATDLARQGVTAVVDLTAEFTEPEAMRRLAYHAMPVLDLTAPAVADIREACRFIEDQSARGVVYIHCKAGYSRTAAVAGAWLLHTGRAGSDEEAVAMLRAARPGMIIRPEARRAIEENAGLPAPAT